MGSDSPTAKQFVGLVLATAASELFDALGWAAAATDQVGLFQRSVNAFGATPIPELSNRPTVKQFFAFAHDTAAKPTSDERTGAVATSDQVLPSQRSTNGET